MEGPTSPPGETSGDGDFYIESNCCLLCGVPESIAPDLFETLSEHCVVKRQPCSARELDLAVEAMWSSEVDCIRYRGRDPMLLERLARAGMAAQADHPQPVAPAVVVRNRASFDVPADRPDLASAKALGAAFKADMRASGRRVWALPFVQTAVWISWFQYNFHLVSFVDQGSGRFSALLGSRNALQGLGFLVDTWLHEAAMENISWDVTGDPGSVSSTVL